MPPRKRLTKPRSKHFVGLELERALATPANSLSPKQVKFLLDVSRKGLIDVNHNHVQTAGRLRFLAYAERRKKQLEREKRKGN